MSCHIYNNNILLRNCPFINISTIVTYSLIQKYIKYVKRTIEIELDACFKTTLLTQLYLRVDILFTCGKHLHDCIISLSGDSLAHKNNLIPPRNIEMPVPSQDIERSCMCVRNPHSHKNNSNYPH
jgi:hypothetical protein